ncbi:MAG TPA: PIN domain-containing protein [Phycisphaerae bacterium]|jgi:predicted nucleic acid-binding protein|nr:PIN domain-containing protein [Phycisphaerae bacterium]HOB74809.1 PIN domain-containing protein [Phycisphaerae bacterium]HOJ54356.1 PIN domain-containing protein [Phycisphaerae bacterium]HOL26827.1 PIN domain-containing protein [Phycisphaerae bacterium]HPP19988.1 PIN domain-containing protein [Phycisphaerae bacterium]
MILVDANVLLRLIQIGHPHQQPALDAIALLRRRDREQFVTCSQALYEMYAVCTRSVDAPYPGLGLTPAAAMTQVEAAERQFGLEPEPISLLGRWKDIVVRYGVVGKSVHDARLVALMVERQIPKLLSFNDSHFTRYAEITVLNPFDVLRVPRV